VLAEIDGFWALWEEDVPRERDTFDAWGPSVAASLEFGPQVKELDLTRLDGLPGIGWRHGSRGSGGSHLDSSRGGWLRREVPGGLPGRACVP
jgi:hypothetical protein